MKDKRSLNLSGGLGLVRNQTTDEMRIGRVQHAHELVKRPPVHDCHGLQSLLLPVLGSSGDTVSEEISHEWQSGLPEEIENIVVERISVLGEPVLNVVSDSTWDAQNCINIFGITAKLVLKTENTLGFKQNFKLIP